MPGAVVPPAVLTFVRGLDTALASVAGTALVATYLHGSAVLGGFVPGRSDVDVLFILNGAFDEETRETSVRVLKAATANCPGRGVELSIVTAASAAHPGPPWPFLLHMTTEPQDEKIVLGSSAEGDPDLLMHYAVCRAAGLVVRGASPDETIGMLQRPDVLTYLDKELGAAIQGASEAYAVLNACRAWRYCVSGEIVSKVDGARFARERGAPPELIRSALAMQLGEQPDRPPSETARAFVAEIRTLLRP